MSETTLQEFVERKDYSRIHSSIEIPDLIEIQKRSYEEFLQREVEPERRKDHGLQAALASVFPIPDYNNTAVLEFTSYTLGTPKYDERECLEQGMTFAVPLKLRVRLVVFDKEDKGSKKKVLDVREQEVYVGELPLMTERGTFIVNGTERVVVSQLHRSPGASFTHDKGRTHSSGKVLYSARIIPYRGSWLDFEFDARDILYVRIDRRRKMPTTILLKAFGFSSDDLLKMYYPVEEIRVVKGKMLRKLDPEIHHGLRCFAACFALDEVRRIEQPAGDVRATPERLLVKQPLQFAIHPRLAAAEPHSHPRLPVEYHQRHAVLLPQLPHGFV